MPVQDVLLVVILGICIVFVGLFAIFCIVRIMAAVIEKTSKPAAAETAAVAAPVSVTPETFPGGVNLNNVDNKSAAILMAIVADELKIPPGELRFISIKEV
jgi:Na+-transporting methylmalonyl-CoA/oxaloacetate decarboxylase gamma subunit